MPALDSKAKKEAPQLPGTRLYKMLRMTFLIIFLVLMLIIAGFLFYYGFFGSDPSDCFYVKGIETPERIRSNIISSANQLNIKVSQGYPLNMAKTFRVWFISGFFGILVWMSLAVPLSQVNLWQIRSKVDQGMLFCLQLLIMSIVAIWLLLGGFWRFSEPGRLSSGEFLENEDNLDKEAWAEQLKLTQETHGYQFAGGRFMWIFYIWLLPALTAYSFGALIVTLIVQPESSFSIRRARFEADDLEARGGHKDWKQMEFSDDLSYCKQSQTSKRSKESAMAHQRRQQARGAGSLLS